MMDSQNTRRKVKKVKAKEMKPTTAEAINIDGILLKRRSGFNVRPGMTGTCREMTL